MAQTTNQVKVLILGDSHIQALKHAWTKRAGSTSGVAFSVHVLARVKNGVDIGDISLEAAISMVSALSGKDLVVCGIGGNQHNVLGIVQHPVPFDVFDVGDEAMVIAPGVQCVPNAALSDVFEARLKGTHEARILEIRRAAKCPVYHLAPPPPKEDSAHILKHHGPVFARAGIEEKGVSPAALRLRLWKVQSRVLRELCARWEVGLVPVPAAAMCPKGFMGREYYADDATHANAAYGELVLSQLEQLALGRAPARGPENVRASV